MFSRLDSPTHSDLTHDSVRAVAQKLRPFWVAAVITGSFLPGSAKSLFGTRPYIPQHPVDPQHRLVHFVTFGLTALLFMLTAERQAEEAALAGKAFLLGCVMELGQFAIGFALVFEWWDLRDDFLGAAGMFVMVKALRIIVSGVRSKC